MYFVRFISNILMAAAKKFFLKEQRMFAHENCSMYVSHDLVLPILYSGLVLPVFFLLSSYGFYGLFMVFSIGLV